jgi:peptidoglycan hydrolase CwlO-like protein
MAQNVVEYVMKIKTKAAEQGLDSLTEELEQLIKELTKADKKGKKSFDETRKSTKKTKEKLKETEKQTNKTTKALTAVGRVRSVWGKVQFAVAGVTTALTLSVVAAFKITQKVTDLTNELNDLAVRSGLTAQSIQGLRQALLASGQPATELNAILSGVATRFATFATEGGAVEKNFKSMGIAILDANGKLRSNNEIMLDGIKKLQSIGDASERSRVAVLLFGKAGSKLNQALAAGNFENFLEFTEKFGIDTGPKASKAAAEFQVSLSSLQTVVNGSLQRLVALFDGQDKVTKGMIKLGSTIVFTTALVEGLDKSYKDLNKTFRTSLEFSLDLMVASLMGPVFMSLSLVTKAAAFLGFEIDNLSNSLKRLVGLGLEKTIDPTNSLTSAFDNAIAEMKKYEELVESFGGSMNGLADATGEASGQMKKLGKESKKAAEDIRTLLDVLDELFAKFTSFKIETFIDSFAIAFDALNKNLDKVFDTSKIDLFVNTLNSSLRRASTQIDFKEGISVPEVTFEGAFMGGFEELLTKIKVGIGEIFSIALEGLGRSASKISGALNKGLSEGATTAITGVLAVLKIAEGLGQRGSTVGEIEKSVEEDIRSRSKAIELGLQALPKILFDVLPPILREATDRIIFGMIQGFATTVREIFDIIRSLFTKEGRQEMTKSIKEGFKASLEEFWRRISVVGGILSKRGGGPYIPSARGGIKFTGADEGLAMLHRGEFVVPETGQMPQAVQRTMGMGQSGINITINAAVVESNAVDELVRQIERRFQTFGSSTSPLFGGR